MLTSSASLAHGPLLDWCVGFDPLTARLGVGLLNGVCLGRFQLILDLIHCLEGGCF